MIETSDTTFELGPFLLHRNKGREHYEAEEFALARRDLELANRIRPEDPDVLYWLGTSYFRLDQHPEAERCFRLLIEQKPGYATLHVNRGIVLYKMNRPSEAEEEFLRALEIDRDTTRPHLYLGLIHARRGDYRAALGHFEQSGAEVMAERMRRRLTGGRSRPEEAAVAEPPESSDLSPVRESPWAEPPTAESFPASLRAPMSPAPAGAVPPVPASASRDDLSAALKAAEPGEPVRSEAVYTPYGEFMVEVSFRGLTLIRRGALAGFAGNVRFAPPAGEEDLLQATGEGRLVLVSPGQRLSMVRVGGASFHVKMEQFVACERSLRRELISLGRREGLSMRVVALKGDGIVTVAASGAPLVLSVDPEHPVSVAAAQIVGWTGDLEPSPIRQGTMEERAIYGAGGSLKLRFQGKGQLVIHNQREHGS